MAIIVETRNLTRRYGATLALDHLTLQIPEGAIYGFIGPNGAGKTTTMRILTTLLQPSSGEAWVGGHSVIDDPRGVRKMVGFMPDFFGVYDSMKAWEYLDFFGRAYGVAERRRATLIGELLELVDLGHKRDEFVMTLSRGMKQRLSLARTMMHDPRLLILDEPASGLDPRARIELRELLKELRALGKTIMISSHILTELAEMCTHIAIIERGRLLASGDVQTILRSLQPHRTLEVRLLDGAARAEELLRDYPGVLSVRRDGTAATVAQEPDAAPGGVAAPVVEDAGATPATEAAIAAPVVVDAGAVPVNGVEGAAEQPAGDGEGASEQPADPESAPPSPAPEYSLTLLVDYSGDDRGMAGLLALLVANDVLVTRFSEQSGDLEDIFMHVTQGLVQ